MVSSAGEDQADLDFNSGFNPDTPPTDRPAPVTDPVAAAEEPVVVPKPEPAPAPKIRQITEDEFTRLDGAIAKMVTPEKVKDLVGGIMGGLEDRIVKKLQASTPRGMTVELPADVVSEMEAEFPELAPHFRKSLEKALKGIRGTATGTSPAALDQEAVQKLVSAATIQIETEALEDAHPTWRDIVGVVDAEGKHDPNNDFRKWLSTQDAAYQHKINATNSAVIISRAIDKFLAAKAAPKPAPQRQTAQAAARKDRIEGAIQPRGDGGQPAPSKTADDEFREGFKSG